MNHLAVPHMTLARYMIVLDRTCSQPTGLLQRSVPGGTGGKAAGRRWSSASDIPNMLEVGSDDLDYWQRSNSGRSCSEPWLMNC